MFQPMSRRDALTAAAAVAALGSFASAQPNGPALRGPDQPPSPCGTPEILGWDAANRQYVLPPLPYKADALEPHIDAKTMEIHHSKHHAAYVAGANKALLELSRIREGGDAGLVKHWSRELSFHLSGHMNHALFWRMMAPAGKGGGGQPSGELLAALERDFGGFDKFVSHFKAAAIQVEGGGWAWLAVDGVSGRLCIFQQEKQQDMLPTGVRPILGVDVWEHAYYLKHQNQRASYLDAFFQVVAWNFVQCLFGFSQRS